jgi:TrmH family RNA methyltransferase
MSFGVVLVEPQGLWNIAHVVRAMRNFGAGDLRVVQPAEWDEYRITGIAHQSHDLVARARHCETLDDALADATHVVAFTARQRRVKRNALFVREAVDEAIEQERDGTVLFLFGREDRGLDNAALDRAHRTATIPTDTAAPSLNLAHAAAVALYERALALQLAAPLRRPRREASPATHVQLEELFGDTLETLHAIEFFKTHSETSIMRTLREIGHRAPLDEREVKLLRAVAIEVRRYLERTAWRS